MPIDFWIHRDRRLVWAKARGTLTAEDLFAYQQTAWSRPDVAGYDELVDMTAVTDIPAPSPAAMRALADLSASMDAPGRRSKFAIAAPDDLSYGLGRMYQTHRELASRTTKDTAVFRTAREALAWLGLPASLEAERPGQE